MDPIANTVSAWAAYGSLLVVLLGAAWLKRQMQKPESRQQVVRAPAPSAAPIVAVQAKPIDTRRALLEKTLSDMAREAQEAPTLPMTRIDACWADTAPFVDSHPAFAATEPAPLEAIAQLSR